MKILIYSNTDWFMYNFNMALAKSLVNRGHEVILLSPPGKYGKELSDLGFHWISAPMERGSLNIFREFRLIFWLFKLFKKERVDLVHSFTLKCVIYGSIAAKFAKIRSTVNSITGMGYVFTSSKFKARLLRPCITILMKLALNRASSRLVVLNNADYNFFTSRNIVDPENIRLIPGAGIDCKKFIPYAVNNNKFTVLLAARLLWDKGISEYIEASRIIKCKGVNISFLLAGAPDSGNPAAVSEKLLAKWASDELITLLGHVDNMPDLLRKVNVVVLPSYREGLPTGLTEAGASGLPLITTDVPGCNEVVTHEIDGLLIPVKNAEALADSILKLYSNPELCSRLGKAARHKAITQFDHKIVIRKTFDIYDELQNTPV